MWTGEKVRYSLSVDAFFLFKTEKKISVLKNIRIHVDGAA